MKWQLLYVLITLSFIACEPIAPQTEVDQNTLDTSLMDSGTVVERIFRFRLKLIWLQGSMVVDSDISFSDMMTEDQDVSQMINLSDSELDQEYQWIWKCRMRRFLSIWIAI